MTMTLAQLREKSAAKVEDNRNGLPIYESHPPAWLPRSHSSADLGYTGFHPPHPGQDEDLMSQANVRNGYLIGEPVPAETFSAQDMVKTRFTQHEALTDLEDLMNDIFARRADGVVPIQPPSYRLPTRVTLSDAKRTAWFADLANPSVPLSKLGKSVPHGAKGHDLLDLLCGAGVEVKRAVWFLRVFGGNETAGLRNKPGYNPSQYSVDWANVVTGYLRKQLADIALPTVFRAGLNIKQTFKGVLADQAGRERWVGRFNYCLKLLRTFYTESLVDNLTFLTWLVHTMQTCTLVQAGFVAGIAAGGRDGGLDYGNGTGTGAGDDNGGGSGEGSVDKGGCGDGYVEELVRRRALARGFVSGAIAKLVEMRVTSAQEYLPNLETLLRSLLQRICLTLPDAFISPTSWTQHWRILEEVLIAPITPQEPPANTNDHGALCSDLSPEQISGESVRINAEVLHQLQQRLTESYMDIKERNEAMLFRSRNSIPTFVVGIGTGRLAANVADIALLNSICSTTNMMNVYASYFSGSGLYDNSTLLTSKLNTLLTWSTTPLQYGDHRPNAASTLIQLWRDGCGERAARRHISSTSSCSSPEEFLQDLLFDWLDECEVVGAGTGGNGGVNAIAELYGLLIEKGLFDFAKYVQRLVARGEFGISSQDTATESQHRQFLRCMPLVAQDSSSSLNNQRKVTLYGVRARETPEDAIERAIRREIRSAIPHVFGNEPMEPYLSTSALCQDCTTLLATSRYEHVRIYKQWLLPLVRKYLETDTTPSDILQAFSVLKELMNRTKCFDSLLELSLLVLKHASTLDLLSSVAETLHAHAAIWVCMQVPRMVTDALLIAHQAARARGLRSRILTKTLFEIDNGVHMSESARDLVIADLAALTRALKPISDTPDAVPGVLPEILLLAGDPTPDAPSILANSLWYKYRTSSDWAWKVWDNTIASLRQVPVITTDATGRKDCALRYGRFLVFVDEHLPGGIDDHVLQWFLGTGRSEVSALSPDAWDVLKIVLFHLSALGALSTTTILRGLVYPAWQLAAIATSDLQAQSLTVFLHASLSLFDTLTLGEDSSSEQISPESLVEFQKFQSRQRDVYEDRHFRYLAASIPTLVMLENNFFFSDLSPRINTLRRSLCKASDFREAVHRYPDVIRAAFVPSCLPDSSPSSLSDPMMNGLRVVLCDFGGDGLDGDTGDWWHNLTRLLTPWRLSFASIQIHFTFLHLGQMLRHEATNADASECVDRLAANLFHDSVSLEEAYFLADMARDVDMSVASKIVDNGLRCLVDALKDPNVESTSQVKVQNTARAGELLRVIAHFADKLRDNASANLELDPETQERLISLLHDQLSLFRQSVIDDDDATQLTSRTVQNLVFLLRLLQFDLGLPGAWTTKTKDMSGAMIDNLFNLALYYGSGSQMNLMAYSCLIDTMYYILDDIPADPKSTTFDPFRNYPTPTDLPSDLPPALYAHITSLMPFTSYNAATSGLFTASRNSTGELVLGSPVVNRPWEWAENLGDIPASADGGNASTGTGTDDKQKGIIKNSASISLDLFKARATGDRIIPLKHKEDSREEATVRSFEDGFHSGSVFRRDWRETRTELDDEDIVVGGGVNKAEEVDELGVLPSFPRLGAGVGVGDKSSSRRTSPVSATSARSQQLLTHFPPGSATSMHSTPTQGPLQPPPLPRSATSSASDPIDVDAATTATSTTTRSTSKRKMSSVSDEDDDDIEILEGPPVNASATAGVGPSRAGKKPKGKTTAKTRAKKR